MSWSPILHCSAASSGPQVLKPRGQVSESQPPCVWSQHVYSGFDVAVGAAEHKPAQVDCSLLYLMVLHVGVVVGTTHTHTHTHTHTYTPFTTAYETDSSNQDYYTDALK